MDGADGHQPHRLEDEVSTTLAGNNNYGTWSDWTAIIGAATTTYTLTGLTVNQTYQVELAATGASNTASTAARKDGRPLQNISESGGNIIFGGTVLPVNEGGENTYQIKLNARPPPM